MKIPEKQTVQSTETSGITFVTSCPHCSKSNIFILDKSTEPLTVIEKECQFCHQTIFCVLELEEDKQSETYPD
jgi:hypothetical protein